MIKVPSSLQEVQGLLGEKSDQQSRPSFPMLGTQVTFHPHPPARTGIMHSLLRKSTDR